MLERYVWETSFNYPMYEAKEDIARVFDVSWLPKVRIYNKGGILALNDEVVYSVMKFRRIPDQLIGA